MEHAMNTEAEIAQKFWKSLKGDRVAMLSLADVEEGHSQPMSAQLLEEHEDSGGPIWFFTSKDTDLVRELGQGHRAQLHFSSKGHDLFASVHGELVPVSDRVTIDRLWNRFVAAWFEGGKEDPKLQQQHNEPDHTQDRHNEKTTLAGIRLLLGRDPKQDYQGKVADLN